LRRGRRRESGSGSRGIVLGVVRDVLGEATLVVQESRSRYSDPTKSVETKTTRRGIAWYSQPGVEDHAMTHWLDGEYPWILEDELNPHVIIVGSSGSGKTSFLKAFLWDLRRVYGVRILVIDFHGEYSELVLAMGGDIVDLSMHSVNPFSSIDLGKPEKPSDRVFDFVESLRVVYPELGSVQIGLAIDTLKSLFASRGIVDENPSTWTLDPPTFEELYNTIARLARGSRTRVSESAETLRLRLEPLLSIFSERTTLSLDQIASREILSIDLSSIRCESCKDLLVEWLLRKLFRYRQTRKVVSDVYTYIAIDEAHRVAKRGSSTILIDIARESRKYRLGLVLSTQRLTDLSSEILVNASTKIMLKMDSSEDLREAASILYGLETQVFYKLPSLGRFEAIVVDTWLSRKRSAMHIRFRPFFEREEYGMSLALKKLREKATPSSGEGRASEAWSIDIDALYPTLSRSLKRVLKTIIENGVYTPTAIARILGTAPSTVSHYLRKLKSMGIVEEVELYSLPRGRRRRLYIPRISRESALHQAMVEDIARYLQMKGYSPSLSHGSGPDIVVTIGGRRIAIEVETGLKHDLDRFRDTVQKRLSVFDKVLIVVPNTRIRDRYLSKLRSLSMVYGDRVEVVDYLYLDRALNRLNRML